MVKDKLHDYDSLTDLVLINTSIFEFMTEKINSRLMKYKKELEAVAPEKAESLILEEDLANYNYDKLEGQT